MNNSATIEERMQNMKNFYLSVERILNNLPDSIPLEVKKMLQNKILGDKELKKIIDGIDAHRPPRILTIGRTGVGKSSLINALCDAYVARVSDTQSCTDGVHIHKYKDGDRVLMEILDTRGLAESEVLNQNMSAENMLMNQISEFYPDVAIFMLDCTNRDDTIVTDIDFLKNVAKRYSQENHVELPILSVVNKCDEAQPSRFKAPSEYPTNKIKNIEEIVERNQRIIGNRGLKIKSIIPVSSYIEWKKSDGTVVSVEEINQLPEYDIPTLEIDFDGRYRIDELFNLMEQSIQDHEAKMD